MAYWYSGSAVDISDMRPSFLCIPLTKISLGVVKQPSKPRTDHHDQVGMTPDPVGLLGELRTFLACRNSWPESELDVTSSYT